MPAERAAVVATTASSINTQLVASEYVLCLLLEANGLWPANVDFPSEPANYQVNGSLEYGIYLYWLNNTGVLSGDAAEAAGWLYDYLDPPQSAITASIYATLGSHTLIGSSGEVASTQTFALYDQGWMIALGNLGLTIYYDGWQYGWTGPLPMPPDTYVPTSLTPATGSTSVVVGLLGDWGAGNQAAKAVMIALLECAPDCIMHLGDVYYSGTPAVGTTINGYTSETYWQQGRETANLVNLWPAGCDIPGFTLNSNHDMYAGAQGLFGSALTGSGPFAAQGTFSVFLVQVGDWNILGLDSAYNGSESGLFMYGTLSSDQIAWIQGLNLDAGKTIVLTHHNGFDPNCAVDVDASYAGFRNALYAALNDAFPYAWFWGHVHNNIVYDQPVMIGTDTPMDTYFRCVGNGSMPYGFATELNSDQILWQAGAAVPDEATRLASDGVTKLLPNGFATLSFEFGDASTISSITENYYYQTYDAPPVPIVPTLMMTRTLYASGASSPA